MGSFNVSCSLSGQSISCGDRAVLIPMTKNFFIQKPEDPSYIRIHPTHHIVNGSDTKPLVPVAIPIFGKYDDYGRISVDRERTPSVELTEAYYGVTIDELAGFVSYEKSPNLSEKFPDRLFGVWIHGDVWDSMIQSAGGIRTIINDLRPTPWVLLKLGFKHTGTHKDKRYNQLWTHPDIDVGLSCDGHFINDIETNCGLYSVSYLIEWCAKHDYDIDISPLGETYSLAQVKSYVHEAMICDDVPLQVESMTRAKVLLDILVKKREEEPDLFCDDDVSSIEYFEERLLRGIRRNHHNWRWLFGGYGHQHMSAAYAGHMEAKDEELLKAISEFMTIRNCFYCCGRVMMPTEGGPQDGEPRFTLALGQALIKVSQKRIDKWETED